MTGAPPGPGPAMAIVGATIAEASASPESAARTVRRLMSFLLEIGVRGRATRRRSGWAAGTGGGCRRTGTGRPPGDGLVGGGDEVGVVEPAGAGDARRVERADGDEAALAGQVELAVRGRPGRVGREVGSVVADGAECPGDAVLVQAREAEVAERQLDVFADGGDAPRRAGGCENRAGVGLGGSGGSEQPERRCRARGRRDPCYRDPVSLRTSVWMARPRAMAFPPPRLRRRSGPRRCRMNTSTRTTVPPMALHAT